jgi:hypothetical protein
MAVSNENSDRTINEPGRFSQKIPFQDSEKQKERPEKYHILTILTIFIQILPSLVKKIVFEFRCEINDKTICINLIL